LSDPNSSSASGADADAQKAAAEVFKQRTEAASSAMTLVYKLAAGLGALTTFSYLLLIQFFPSGMTPGEVIFFTFIALAFTFTYIVIILYGAFSAIWIAHLMFFIATAPKFKTARLVHEL
jgi:hypothetical protein